MLPKTGHAKHLNVSKDHTYHRQRKLSYSKMKKTDPTLALRMCRFINLVGRHLILDQKCISLAQNYLHKLMLYDEKRRLNIISASPHYTATACLSLALKTCNKHRSLYLLMDCTFHFMHDQKKTTPKKGTLEAIKEMELLQKTEFNVLTAIEFRYNLVLPYKELYDTFERLFRNTDKAKVNGYFQFALNFLNDFMRIGGVVRFSSTALVRGSMKLAFMMRDQHLANTKRLSERLKIPSNWLDDVSWAGRRSIDKGMDKLLTHYETCLGNRKRVTA